MKGYFQSSKYFSKYRDKILELFQLSSQEQKYVDDYFSKVKSEFKECKQVVSLHVRRGDYLKLPDFHTNLTMEYYTKAIENFPSALFMVFSDDIEWCKENIKIPNVHYVSERDVIDLSLMSKCDSHILANSSFGWWGAYLNTKPDKKVVAPSRWFVKDDLDTRDLYEAGWIKI